MIYNKYWFIDNILTEMQSLTSFVMRYEYWFKWTVLNEHRFNSVGLHIACNYKSLLQQIIGQTKSWFSKGDHLTYHFFNIRKLLSSTNYDMPK